MSSKESVYNCSILFKIYVMSLFDNVVRWLFKWDYNNMLKYIQIVSGSNEELNFCLCLESMQINERYD